MNFVVFVLPVFNSCDVQCSSVWKYQTIWFLRGEIYFSQHTKDTPYTPLPVAALEMHPYQPLVPCIDNSIEHGLIEQAVAHPL